MHAPWRLDRLWGSCLPYASKLGSWPLLLTLHHATAHGLALARIGTLGAGGELRHRLLGHGMSLS
jgi:hypothetical protein